MHDLSTLERIALKVLEERGQMLSYQLPNGIGYRTMAKLVEKGLAELVDRKIGRYAQNYGWRLAGWKQKRAD